jgi:endonuclease YncB( thermonuclease family)
MSRRIGARITPVQLLIVVGGLSAGALLGLTLGDSSPDADVPLRTAAPAQPMEVPVSRAGSRDKFLERDLPDQQDTAAIEDAADDAVNVASSGLESFTCRSPEVVDGDTLRCGSRRVRLHGIDAPEMPSHCRPGRECVEGDPFASTDHLRALTDRSELICTAVDLDGYGRTVARCEAGGVDLSCAQIEAGHAVRRYGDIRCG